MLYDNVRNIIFTSLAILFYCFSFSQINENRILKSYQDFIEVPKEIVYTHLNKSIFIKDELLAFNAYVIDKAKKTPSKLIANLYCTISDENDKIIKSKLIRVQNGLAHNTFEIDSLFTSGTYTFRAYTNWMRNFNERNYYEHSFQVVDPEAQKQLKQTSVQKNYTIQVLPEGGHFLSDVKNNVGIIVKDVEGFGLANTKGKIINQNNQVVTEFTLNQFGVAKTSLTPLPSVDYRVIISHNDTEITSQIDNIDVTGIAMTVSNLRGKVALAFKTNQKTAQLIKTKTYSLVIHNGSQLKVTSFKFDGQLQVSKIIGYKTLFSGINIFTVFDNDQNVPILERMFFNSDGISKAALANFGGQIKADSITVELKLNQDIDLSKIQNLSVSILPAKTKSYNFNSTIFSQTYLEPYVKGFIENAAYYFSENTPKVRYDLDNLLLTQGWSSYDWKTIFQKNELKYSFEHGIQVVAKINDKKNEGYLIHPLKNNVSQIFTPEKANKNFTHTNVFPENNEFYKVSLLNKKGEVQKPSLSLNFYPSTIPNLVINSYKIPIKNIFIETYKDEGFVTPIKGKSTSISEVQVLDEVVVEANTKEAIRIEKIKLQSYGTVEFLNDENTPRGTSLARYLNKGKGFEAIENYETGELEINSFSTTLDNPVVILNGVIMHPNFLLNFTLDDAEYVEIVKGGAGFPIAGTRPVINIVTNPVKRYQMRLAKKKFVDVSKYTFPLVFNPVKKYYVPIYKDYTSSFFQQLGIIDWKPNLKVDENGAVTFKIRNTKTKSFNLYIEGIVNGKSFVSQMKTINL